MPVATLALLAATRPVADRRGGPRAAIRRPATATAASRHASPRGRLAFHDAMRKLWEDHITWTRLAIVSFAAGLPDLQATEARLLANQVDIGNAIKPYYGRTAGNRLTALLKEHILGAVALLQAAKAGDQAAIAQGERGVVRQRQPDRRLPAPRQSAPLVARRDAGDDEDPPRPDARRGPAPPPGQLRRRHPRLRRGPPPHPRDGGHAQRRHHRASSPGAFAERRARRSVRDVDDDARRAGEAEDAEAGLAAAARGRRRRRPRSRRPS